MVRPASGVAVVAGVLAVARHLHRTWGSTAQERARSLPGDELLAGAELVCTRAISIAAPAASVWPWVAQLGQERGGFYSYDRLENLAGCQVRSADAIVDAWQHPEVGDPFHLHPQVALEVAVVAPGRALVVAGIAPAGTPGPPYDFTWAFVVDDDGAGGSRLVVRERYRRRSPGATVVIEPLAAASWFMTQRMLRGIRDRARSPHDEARPNSG